MGGVNPLVAQEVVTSLGVMGRIRVPFEYLSSPMLQPQAHAGQPETLSSAVTNQEVLDAVNGNAAALMAENRALKAEVASIKRSVDALSSSKIYFAVKKKLLLCQIGHTDNWDRRRKEHERNGWEIIAVACEPQTTEKRFKWILKTQGIEKVGGKGLDEVYPLNDAFLQIARNFGWPLGVYQKPITWRKSSKFSKPGNDSGQKELFNGAA